MLRWLSSKICRLENGKKQKTKRLTDNYSCHALSDLQLPQQHTADNLTMRRTHRLTGLLPLTVTTHDRWDNWHEYTLREGQTNMAHACSILSDHQNIVDGGCGWQMGSQPLACQRYWWGEREREREIMMMMYESNNWPDCKITYDRKSRYSIFRYNVIWLNG